MEWHEAFNLKSLSSASGSPGERMRIENTFRITIKEAPPITTIDLPNHRLNPTLFEMFTGFGGSGRLTSL